MINQLQMAKIYYTTTKKCIKLKEIKNTKNIKNVDKDE